MVQSGDKIHSLKSVVDELRSIQFVEQVTPGMLTSVHCPYMGELKEIPSTNIRTTNTKETLISLSPIIQLEA